MNARITLAPDFTDLVFTWEGGAFIDVWFSDPIHNDPTGDVINVYDYEMGRAVIRFTPKGMERACKRYVKELKRVFDSQE